MKNTAKALLNKCFKGQSVDFLIELVFEIPCSAEILIFYQLFIILRYSLILTAYRITYGGGCENVGAQYSLPTTAMKAGRDLEGVRKVAPMHCTKRRVKVARLDFLAYRSGGIEAPVTQLQKKSFSTNLEIIIRMKNWLYLKKELRKKQTN